MDEHKTIKYLVDFVLENSKHKNNLNILKLNEVLFKFSIEYFDKVDEEFIIKNIEIYEKELETIVNNDKLIDELLLTIEFDEMDNGSIRIEEDKKNNKI